MNARETLAAEFRESLAKWESRLPPDVTFDQLDLDAKAAADAALDNPAILSLERIQRRMGKLLEIGGFSVPRAIEIVADEMFPGRSAQLRVCPGHGQSHLWSRLPVARPFSEIVERCSEHPERRINR